MVEPANSPPNTSGAVASVSQIWLPDNKMKEIKILNVTDSDGDPVTIEIVGITQDEPVKGAKTGNLSPDGSGIGTDKLGYGPKKMVKETVGFINYLLRQAMVRVG